jgi:hypothetical protein
LGGLATAMVGLGMQLYPGPAEAVLGAADNAPASTVLVPYFEVDLSNANGASTLVALTNTSATAVLANVVLWSDQGIPAASFNTYLTGYDIQSFNVRDVLNGVLPRTASDGQDPADTLSPQGQLSQDINFASCTTTFPYAATVTNLPGPGTPGPTPADVRAMLTGQASTGLYAGQCVGTARGDNVARGYITVDTLTQCTNLVPGNAGYFTGVIAYQNALAAEYFLVNSANNLQYAGQAAAIETGFPGASTPGTYTFYASVNNFLGTDEREVLPTTWMADVERVGSELIVWRDPKIASQPHACGAAPTYGSLPIGDNRGTGAFDSISSPFSITGNTAIAPNVSQRFNVAAPPLTGLPAAGKLGWLYLSFNHAIPAAGGLPAADPAAAQSTVLVLRRPEGLPATYHVAIPATPLDTGRSASHGHPPFPVVP